jgi:hypothetical protein
MRETIILFTLAFCVCTSAFAQKIPVPQAANDAFAAKFPNAEKIKWDKENSSEFEANFTLEGTQMSAVFTNDGTWKETETTIDISQLPQPVIDSVNHNYSGGKLFGASKIVRADGSTVYEADIKIKKKKKEVLFDEKGNILE